MSILAEKKIVQKRVTTHKKLEEEFWMRPFLWKLNVVTLILESNILVYQVFVLKLILSDLRTYKFIE